MASERREFARNLRRRPTRGRTFFGNACAARAFTTQSSAVRSRSTGLSSTFTVMPPKLPSNSAASSTSGIRTTTPDGRGFCNGSACG